MCTLDEANKLNGRKFLVNDKSSKGFILRGESVAEAMCSYDCKTFIVSRYSLEHGIENVMLDVDTLTQCKELMFTVKELEMLMLPLRLAPHPLNPMEEKLMQKLKSMFDEAVPHYEWVVE